jgi:hypothetical protein
VVVVVVVTGGAAAVPEHCTRNQTRAQRLRAAVAMQLSAILADILADVQLLKTGHSQ